MLLNIEPGLVIWTIITFIVLLVVLRALAWKPLLTMLSEREARIQEALAQADKARQEAEAAVAENRAAMAKAQAEAQQAVAEGRAAAERVAQEVRQKAEAEAQQMLEQAQRTIRHERDQAIQALKSQVAELAVLAAGRILDENMDDARNRRLVDQFIDQVPGGNAS